MIETQKEQDKEQEQLRNVIKDTQMLIRKSMLKHKKFAKELHTNIKKDKYNCIFYENIGKQLICIKKKLRSLV